MDGKDTTILRNRFRRALFAAAATGITQALWAAGPRIAFDIPASEFSQAIIQFYKQTNVEILYASPGSLGPVKTRAVAGELEVSEALTRMLEGTGYTFEFENPHSVLLKRADDGRAVVEAAQEPGWGPAQSDDAPWRLAEVSSANAPQAQDVVVTGTFIHGVLDIVSPLVRITKDEMKNTAYATVQDALQTLMSNSGGGFGDDVAGSSGNYNRGTAPNLRGLGYGATLVLVNGRRQPLAGSAADFVDLSNIPWNAVERIEVLPDGTSALYGSDAIAGVVNIVMRDDIDGAETQGRLASALGGGDEKVFAQLFGSHWDSGRWLASYQFSERGALAAADRSYTANADKRSLGGTDHRSFWGNPGNILDPNTLEPIFAIPAGQDGTALTPADLLPGVVNLHNTFATYDLTPERQMHSLLLNGSQKLGDSFELYAEARLSKRHAEQRQLQLNQLLVVPSTNPFFVDVYGATPFVLVAYSFDADLGATRFRGKTLNYDGVLGVRAELGTAWHTNLAVSYGREDLRWSEFNVPDLEVLDAALADPNPATAFNPFGDGSKTSAATLEAIRSTARSQIMSDIMAVNFVADGPLFELPTGAVKLAMGIEARQESLHQKLAERQPAGFGRDITSIFTEISAPLIGKRDQPRAIPRLELSLAGRYEKYSDFGSTFNLKVGLRWAPLNWAKLRTSWGTSFKAPRLLDLYDTSQNAAGLIVLSDPGSVTGQSLVLVRQGNNSGLKQETAATWTAGIDLMPTMAPGMTMSLTYYGIDYEDRILIPGSSSPFDILYQESQWLDAITRDPSPQDVAAVCSSPEFLGSPVDCLSSSPAAIIDFRLRNLAITRTKGIDLKLDYAFNTRRGAFQIGLSGNRVFSFEQALSRSAPDADILDTVGNPLSFRVRSTVDWEQHGKGQRGLYAGMTVDHTGGYRDVDASLQRRINALTTLDLRLGYRYGRGDGWLGDTEVTLNAVNIFNEAPPFIDHSFGYDVMNADPTGRVVAVYVQKSW